MRFANYRRRFLGFLRLSAQPLVFKDEPHEQEIDRNGNGKHRHRRQRLGNAQPQKQIQQPHVKQIVDQMGATETKSPAPRRPLPEREVSRQIEVGHKADGIAQRIGHIDIDDPLQDKIDTVMQRRGKHAHHHKTEKFG